jgi:hypothetical protein
MYIIGCPWKGTLFDQNEHSKVCYFNESEMPEYIKQMFALEEKENNKNVNIYGEEEDNGSNEFTSFNINAGLKARLYNKNKILMDKALNKTPNRSSDKNRDSILDLLDNHLSRRESQMEIQNNNIQKNIEIISSQSVNNIQDSIDEENSSSSENILS